MNARKEALLGLPYDKEMGPLKIGTLSIKAAENGGINCQAFAQLYAVRLGIEIPPGFLSSDFFEDMKHSRLVDPTKEPLRAGDIYLFGRKKTRDPRSLHIAVFTGERNEAGVPLLAHATVYEGQSAIWPLDKFAFFHGTESLKAIKRFTRR